MLKNKKKLIILSVLVTIILVIALILIFSTDNEVEALSKYGSRGDEVTQIQTKFEKVGIL